MIIQTIPFYWHGIHLLFNCNRSEGNTSGAGLTPFLLAILLFDIDKIVSYSHLFFLYQAIESSKPDCKLNVGTKANSLIAV